MRMHSPDFYGYIPDGGSRTVVFGCMMLQGALLLLIRSFSAAMLILMKKRYFVAYLAGDTALYLLQKVARGDFHYWFPVDGVFGLFISLLLRVIVKILADFTGVIQFRADAELGGLYWTVNIFLALLASFVCVWVGGGGGMEWMLVGAASGAFTLSFGLFLLLMKKEYRSSFFDTKTGKQWAMDFFLKGEDDKAKQNVLGCNKKMWRAIRGEVKEWVGANWWRWEEDRPEWFTVSWVAKVPDDMIPTEAKQAVKNIHVSASRRSNFSLVAGEGKIAPRRVALIS